MVVLGDSLNGKFRLNKHKIEKEVRAREVTKKQAAVKAEKCKYMFPLALFCHS